MKISSQSQTTHWDARPRTAKAILFVRSGGMMKTGIESKARLFLEIANDVSQPDAKRFCDSEQRINSHGPFRSFHLADVNRVKVRLFGQFLLAEAGIFAVQPNVLPNQTAVFWSTDHSRLPRHRAAKISHKLPALDFPPVFACVSGAGDLKVTHSLKSKLEIGESALSS